MQCPNCEFENTEQAKTCARCGAVLKLSGLQPPEPEPQPQEPARKRGRTCSVTGCVIIALLMIVLVVIAFPRLMPKREKARATSCLSNVKQLQLGMLMYAQDHDDTMPPASAWCDLIYPYVKNKQLYVCPQVSDAVGTYAMNDSLSGREQSAIPSPEATVCLFDSAIGWNMHGGPSLIVNRHEFPTTGTIDWIFNGRRNGANFGFADGHAKWVGPGSPSSYTWYLPPPPVGRDAASQPLDPEEGE